MDSCSSENFVRECGVFAVFIYFFFICFLVEPELERKEIFLHC